VSNREHGDAGKSRRLLIIGWNYIVSERSVDVPLLRPGTFWSHGGAFATALI
jgi:hypothetical protein